MKGEKEWEEKRGRKKTEKRNRKQRMEERRSRRKKRVALIVILAYAIKLNIESIAVIEKYDWLNKVELAF